MNFIQVSCQTFFHHKHWSNLACHFSNHQSILLQRLHYPSVPWNWSCHFLKHKSVSSQILHHSSMLWHFTPLCFFSSNVIYFQQKYHISMQIFRLVIVSIKVCQIPYLIFETKSQLSCKICITIQCHVLFHQRIYPPNMRRRSNVSVRYHISQNVANHAETSSRRLFRYVNETDLFETSLRLIGTLKKPNYLRRHNDVPIDT